MEGKVLVLTNFISGLYCFRREVIKGIKEAGYNVYLSYPDVDSNCVDDFNNMGCNLNPIPFDRRGVNPFSDLKLLLNYWKLIKQLKPIAVLTYTIKPNVYGGIACKMCGVPQFANITGLGDAIENGGLMQKLTLFLYRIGISKSKRIFFQNSSNRNFFIKKSIADTSSVLLPGSGVNLEYHSYQDYPIDGKIKFLYIGSTKKDKGVEELFKAASSIKEKYNDVVFHFLGSIENGYETQFQELISKGVFEFFEHAKDVRPFIGESHCTIMPSYHEGMSNVNLESSANGRPVITTDVPGCRETVDDGKTGILVRSKDAQSLYDGIEKFLMLSYEEKRIMGINARKKMEREFDRQLIVNTYLSELANIS